MPKPTSSLLERKPHLVRAFDLALTGMNFTWLRVFIFALRVLVCQKEKATFISECGLY
jgi:hypothetical protein